jgi:CRISPR-associated protein Csm1
MKNRARVSLYIASLLHDLGKPLERAGYDISAVGEWFKEPRYSHPRFGAAFLEVHKKELSGISEILDTVQRIVRNHHEPSALDETIVQLSDWLSAGERKFLEAEEGEEALKAKDARLVSIFSSVFKQVGDYDCYYKLGPLSFKKESIFPVKEGKIEKDKYEELVKLLERDFQNLSGFSPPTKLFADTFLETLFFLFYKYFWSVPAQTPKAGYRPDVSLFDHSRITAALSVCLFDNIEANLLSSKELETICRKLKNFNFDPPEDDEDTSKELFILVAGDLSGIQEFVFNIPSKGAAKSLKGRSLYLELLTELIAKYFLKELDLPIANLIYCGGGNFYLILPISAKKVLPKLRKKILEVLLNAHHGSLYMAVEWVQLAVKDFFGGRIVDRWRDLGEKVGQLKRKRFAELGLEENFAKLFGPFESEDRNADLCQVCHQRKELVKTTEEEEKICSFCNSFKELTGELKGAHYYSESAEEGKFFTSLSSYKEVFKSFGFDVTFERNPQAECLNYFLGDPLEWKVSTEVAGFRFIPLGIPLVEEEVKSFDEIAQDSEGVKALGLLKMDVDNLGCIFRKGLPEKQETLSRIAALSRLFHFYFSGYINTLWEKNFKETVYIIFAGGDDSLIFGAWDKLYEFMKLIREDFIRFVAENPNITISASFSMFPVKSPVVKSVAVAEERLSEAKGKAEVKEGLPSDFRYKNVISVLGVPLKYTEFQEMEGLYKELLSVKDRLSEEDALRLARKVIRATRGFKGILEDSLKGSLKPSRVWRFAYFLRKERRELKDTVEKLVARNEEIILENISGKKVVETHLIMPLAAKLVDFRLRRT